MVRLIGKTMLTDCGTIRDWLVEYREKELSPSQSALVEKHLELCQGCRKELQAFDDLVSAIATLPTVDPWPGFARRLESRLEKPLPRAPRSWLCATGSNRSWIGGVFLLLASATISSDSPRLHLFSRLNRPPQAVATAGDDVSVEQLSEREVWRIIGLWNGSTQGWDNFPDWLDRKFMALMLENLEQAPAKALNRQNQAWADGNTREAMAGLGGVTDVRGEKQPDRKRQ